MSGISMDKVLFWWAGWRSSLVPFFFEPVFDAKSVFPQCREDDFPFQQLSSNIVSHFIFRQKSMRIYPCRPNRELRESRAISTGGCNLGIVVVLVTYFDHLVQWVTQPQPTQVLDKLNRSRHGFLSFERVKRIDIRYHILGDLSLICLLLPGPAVR